MALKPYERAILTIDMPEEGLSAGDVGTIVDEHHLPGVDEVGYSVEFFDMAGNTVAVITVGASRLREPAPTDRPSVRVLESRSVT